MKKTKAAALLAALSLALTAFSGCNLGDPGKDLPSADTDGGISAETTAGSQAADNSIVFAEGRATMLSLAADNSLLISRQALPEEKSMGESGVWTVFVYLCGTDLESNGAGQATEDLREMRAATQETPNLRFVVETGGTGDWAAETIEGNKKQRIVIQNGELTTVYTGEETNMGDPATLSDFLVWGVKNYASENMGVVFWNHGGGSISGVCFDELHDYDSLTLREIETAFSAVFANMTDKFEFIGFDACLMATIEAANVLVPFARYMYASEELESGYGWKYEAFGEVVAENSSADGLTLGKAVCDEFFKDNQEYGEEAMATLSVVDLSKIDAFMQAFNVYAKSLYEAAGSSQNAEIVRAVSGVESYGGNNRAEGYTNMVDLGGIIKATEAYTTGADAALEALKGCVPYKVQGYLRPDGYGLSSYYPLEVQGSEEISTFKDICVSPYYVTFVDLVAYSGGTNGETAGFDDSTWLGDDSWFWSDGAEDVPEDDSWYWSDDEADDGSYNFDTAETALGYSVYPFMSDDGYYCLTLSPESLPYLDKVYCNILMSGEDNGTDIKIDLGTDDYVDVNWETGEISDNFNGYWFALPDGQPLAVYLIEESDDYNIYSAPVYINGSDEVSYLRIEQAYFEDSYTTTILGVVNGLGENGYSSRESEPLNVGDVITPCYTSYYADTGELYGYFEGDAFTYTGESELTEALLYESDYYYGYEIYDIYGNILYTDFTMFSVDTNGDVYFYADDSAEADTGSEDDSWGWGDDYDWFSEDTDTADEWLFD